MVLAKTHLFHQTFGLKWGAQNPRSCRYSVFICETRQGYYFDRSWITHHLTIKNWLQQPTAHRNIIKFGTPFFNVYIVNLWIAINSKKMRALWKSYCSRLNIDQCFQFRTRRCFTFTINKTDCPLEWLSGMLARHVRSTPEMSDNLSKKIKNSEVKIIPVGKHLCSIECSYDVNKAIKDHIQNAWIKKI